MSKLQVYAGDGFEVTYDPKVCTHAGECVRGLPQVFDSRASPWIRPGAAPVERIAEVVARCPSGALKLNRAAAAAKPPAVAAAPARSTVQVSPNGPLVVSGEFEIRSPDGTVLFQGQKAALCRCGQSKNKPFCDGAHRSAGFTG